MASIESHLTNDFVLAMHACMQDIVAESCIDVPSVGYLSYQDMCLPKKERPKAVARFAVDSELGQLLSALFLALVDEINNTDTLTDNDTWPAIVEKLVTANATCFARWFEPVPAFGATLQAAYDRQQYVHSKLMQLVTGPAQTARVCLAQIARTFDTFIKAMAFRAVKTVRYHKTGKAPMPRMKITGAVFLGAFAATGVCEEDLDTLHGQLRPRVPRKPRKTPARPKAAATNAQPINNAHDNVHSDQVDDQVDDETDDPVDDEDADYEDAEGADDTAPDA